MEMGHNESREAMEGGDIKQQNNIFLSKYIKVAMILGMHVTCRY